MSTPTPSRWRSFNQQYGATLLFVLAFLGVMLIYIVYLPRARPEQLALVLRTLLMGVAGFLPFVLYLSFARGRLKTVYNEFRQNLRRLGFPENASIYADKFLEIYSYLPGSAEAQAPVDPAERAAQAAGEGPARRYSLTVALPIVFATSLSFFGWIIVFYPLDGQPPSGLNPVDSPVAYGFLGAYVFSMASLIRQYFADDVQPRYFAGMINRYLTVLAISWLAPLLAPEQLAGDALLLACFVAGIFPWEFIRIIGRKVFQALGVENNNLDEAFPLSKLDGLNVFQEDRLSLEGIENLQNMACANLVDLMLRTRYPVERLVDWIDQSLLYLHARALLPAFQISGVRTASDFIDIYQPQILVLDGGSAAPQALDIQARRQRLAALLKSQLVEPRVSEKLAPAYATAIDEAGVSTLLAATAQALVDASNIYHVRYWRQHEFEALPDDVERERTRADLRLMQGLPNEAIEIYNQVLQRFPSSHNTLLYRGLAYFQMRSYPRAIQDYQAALAGGGEHWHNRKTAFMELGRACREMESYAEARAWYEHALQQDPDFAEARLEMAYLQLTHLQEYEPAIQNLDLLAGGEYRKAEALANRGLARYSLYKQRQPAAQPDPALLAQAQADLTLALRLDPGLIAAYLNLAQVQIEQPAPILAIQTLTRAIPQIESQRSALEAGQVGGRGATAQALTENAYRVRLQRGNLYFNNQKYDLAAEDYRAAANLAPFDVAAVYNLGKAQQKLGLRSDAIRSFRETVRLKPGHAPAHQDLGDLLLQEHLQPDAEKAYATAYTLTVELKDLPGQALALLSLGRLYRTLPGREADAQRELERARRLGDNLEDEQLYTSATYELGVLLAASQPEQAAVLLDTSASLFELLKRPRESARAAAQLGVVLRKLNERPRSYEAFQRAGAQLYQVYDASNSEDQALEKLIKDGLKGAPRRPAGAPAGPAAPGEAGGAAAPAAPASPTVPAAPVSPEPGLQPAD